MKHLQMKVRSARTDKPDVLYIPGEQALFWYCCPSTFA